jgi:hypothetical protein
MKNRKLINKFKVALKDFLKPIKNKITNSFATYPPDIALEETFVEIYEQCIKQTMVSIDRSFCLYKAIQYVSRNKIPGEFVECGVWRGGQAMLAAYTLIKEKDMTRKMFLYDTYAGMSKPGELDVRLGRRTPTIKEWENANKAVHNEWCYASLDEVKENMFLTGYPKENFIFVKGKVEETIPDTIPIKIALLRLDTDFYESTYHELKYLYPVLQPGGILMIDDYGSWAGSREAVDQYFKEHNINILLHRIGPGRIGIKM